MAVAGFAYDFTGISGRVIAVWYKNSNLSAEVGRKLLDLPNGVGSFSVEDLQKALYVFKFYQSSDGTTLETLLRQVTYNANTQKVTSETFEYVVGRGQTGDPEPDTNILSDSRLSGALKTELAVKRRGVGELIQVEFNFNISGEIELVEGDVFYEGEIFHITRQYTVTEPEPEQSGGGDYTDIVPFSAGFDFSAQHLNKIFQLVGGAETIVITFDDFSLIPDGKAKFVTNGSTAIYLKLQFASGNSVAFYGKNRNKIYLGKGESFEIYFKSGGCFAVSPVKDTGYERVGETEMSNYKDKPNTVLCSGDGIEHDIASYERLIEELPSEMKVTYDQWNETANVTVGTESFTYYYNRRKFAVDTINGKFKFPDLRNVYFKTLSDFNGNADPYRLSQGAGGFQHKQFIRHRHAIRVTDGDQGPTMTIADGGNSSFPISMKPEICVEAGGDNHDVDNAGKYGFVWL